MRAIRGINPRGTVSEQNPKCSIYICESPLVVSRILCSICHDAWTMHDNCLVDYKIPARCTIDFEAYRCDLIINSDGISNHEPLSNFTCQGCNRQFRLSTWKICEKGKWWLGTRTKFKDIHKHGHKPALLNLLQKALSIISGFIALLCMHFLLLVLGHLYCCSGVLCANPLTFPSSPQPPRTKNRTRDRYDHNPVDPEVWSHCDAAFISQLEEGAHAHDRLVTGLISLRSRRKWPTYCNSSPRQEDHSHSSYSLHCCAVYLSMLAYCLHHSAVVFCVFCYLIRVLGDLLGALVVFSLYYVVNLRYQIKEAIQHVLVCLRTNWVYCPSLSLRRDPVLTSRSIAFSQAGIKARNQSAYVQF